MRSLRECSSSWGTPPLMKIPVSLSSSWILVYVDDMLLVSKSEAALDQLRDELQSQFPIKDLGAVSQFLGL